MQQPFSLDPHLYARLLDQLTSLHFADTLGKSADLDFLRDDQWLRDAAVIEQLSSRRGLWEINLVFAHHHTPLTFLTRRITAHQCPKRANMMAVFMRRLAAKDQRGTLQVKSEGFHLPAN